MMLNFAQITSTERFNRKLRLPDRDGGFSLIELLIVLAVIGILAAIAIPSITRTLDLRRLDSSAFLLSSKLSDARMSAIKRNRQAWLLITPAARTMQVQTRDNDGLIINLGVAETLPSGVDFTAPTAATEVTFDSLGRLPSGTSAWTVTLRGAQNTNRKTVAVSVIGKITVANMINFVG